MINTRLAALETRVKLTTEAPQLMTRRGKVNITQMVVMLFRLGQKIKQMSIQLQCGHSSRSMRGPILRLPTGWPHCTSSLFSCF